MCLSPSRLAHLFRRLGVGYGDRIALMLENHPRYFEICWAAQRAGIIYTAISSRLTAGEAAYIVGDCGAKVFITSRLESFKTLRCPFLGTGTRHVCLSVCLSKH